MRKPRQRSTEIRRFILENVSAHPRDITRLTSNRFRISRPAVLGHIHRLADLGFLDAEGATRARSYSLRLLVDDAFRFSLTADAEEDRVWRHLVRPVLHDLPDNVMRICEFGMNEMLNNAIDHSEGSEAVIHIQQSAVDISFLIQDNGLGIFNRILRNLPLSEPRQAILELAKGKLTTDPSRHTGEGIFFVSRMFDEFAVFSEGLFFSPNEMSDQQIAKLQRSGKGTGVRMRIGTRSKRTMEEVLAMYTSDQDDSFAFSSTDVPVSLASFAGDHLVSRSQARRLLARLREFHSITLDFEGIDSVGQAFADEVFRVFARNNPEIEVVPKNTNAQVDRMIRRVRAGTR
jgi:anti-sigma regulatory factor (Ser/Thr protein kinase)